MSNSTVLLGQSTGSTLQHAARGTTCGQLSRVPYPVIDRVDFVQPLDIQEDLGVGPAIDIPMFSSGNLTSATARPHPAMALIGSLGLSMGPGDRAGPSQQATPLYSPLSCLQSCLSL